MNTKTIQITEVTVQELADIVADRLIQKLEPYLQELTKPKNEELLTRFETAEYLRVSLVTISAWSKLGIINPIRMGNKVLFKKQHILDILEQQRINKKR
ncbi:helix-turn-helix domain-containing protein [Zhouia spongiae]|uniref:Helix-turn-helix domain-containing protein n=1 Tax=Zhouia spongiae TaxID=2202721 RepID=A0ABY3YQE1_9FLAO|nr:helix-turn-helix domain-containing protein [Zhouia spongiae]UNY99868.1 helix-turn-helix domain-containing protein [Zhouia spongiae]